MPANFTGLPLELCLVIGTEVRSPLYQKEHYFDQRYKPANFRTIASCTRLQRLAMSVYDTEGFSDMVVSIAHYFSLGVSPCLVFRLLC